MGGTVEQQVIGILAAQALIDPASIRPDMPVDALGLDSLGLVEAVFAIEETFDVAVPFTPNAADRPAFDTTTVAGLVQAVEGLLAQKAA